MGGAVSVCSLLPIRAQNVTSTFLNLSNNTDTPGSNCILTFFSEILPSWGVQVTRFEWLVVWPRLDQLNHSIPRSLIGFGGQSQDLSQASEMQSLDFDGIARRFWLDLKDIKGDKPGSCRLPCWVNLFENGVYGGKRAGVERDEYWQCLSPRCTPLGHLASSGFLRYNHTNQ